MRSFTHHRIALLCVCLATALCAAALVGQQRQASQSGAPAAGQSAVERGKYLVTVQDCNGCHTPFKNGEPDLTKMLQGHPQDAKITAAPKLPPGWVTAISETNTAWSTPAGVAFTSNLTPDKATGIGGWTEETFINAIRKGKHLGSGRPILPPMPWKMYSNLTDSDLKAIFEYLKTIPPISNKVPAPIMPAGQRQ